MDSLFYWLGVITFCLIIVVLIVNFKWVKKTVLGFFVGKGLIESSKKLAKEINEKRVSSESLADFGAQVFIRLTRLGILGLFIAAIPTILLHQQNKLLKIQNEKFDSQNRKIDTQNMLILDQSNLFEASRISAYNFRLGNIFDRINEEIENQKNKGKSKNLILSDFLVSRISAIIMAFEPYYMLDNDELTMRQLSPERGQLIVALSNLELDSITMSNILQTPFNSADLTGAYLENAQLPGVDLQRSYIVSCNLRNSNLKKSNLMGAVVISTNMAGIDLEGSHCVGINTEGSGIYFEGANLKYVNFRGVDLSNSSLKNADLTGASIQGSKFINADFMGTKISSKQLLTAKTLYNVRNLSDSLHTLIMKIKPELFQEYVEPKIELNKRKPEPLFKK